MANILFSMAGYTDPIMDKHDGPILQIVRHYPIDRLYLFLTREMSHRSIYDNVFRRAIKSVRPNIEIKEIHTRITNPHEDEPMTQILKEKLDAVHAYHENDTLYVNMTSGTPQMCSILSHLIVISNIVVTPLIVHAHHKRTNVKKETLNNPEQSIRSQIETNQDRLPGAAKRVSETNLIKYRQLMVFSQVKAMIDKFDYRAALGLIEKTRIKTSKLVKDALQHGHHRMHLKQKSANRYALDTLNPESSFNFTIKDTFIARLKEYFLIIEAKQIRGDLSDMVLMLEPFSIALFDALMPHVFGYEPSAMPHTLKAFSRDKLKKHAPSALHTLEQKYGKKSRLKKSIQAYCAIYQKALKKTSNTELLELVNAIRTIKNLRNVIAHELRTTNDDEIEKKTGLSSLDIVYSIRYQLVEVLKIPETSLDIYNTLNTVIKDELDKMT